MPAMPPARLVRENNSAPSEQVRAPTGDAALDPPVESAERARCGVYRWEKAVDDCSSYL